MPFLSKHFTFDYDFSSARPVYCTLRRNRTDGEKSVDYRFFHRPTLSAMFYNNLKETLQHTTLENITYYDDDLSIKIFGINLKFACAQNSDSTSNYYCTPIALEQFINSDGVLQNNNYINRQMEYKTITATTDKNIKTISYGIKMYYNNNFIICNCESYLRFEIPIFCIIQGNTNNSPKKVAYLGQCPNVVGTDYSYEAFYHRLVIPDESSEQDSVFPSDDNKILYNQTFFDNTQVHYIFDADVYPNRKILNTLYDTDTQFQSVYMKKLTSWNGLVQYNNVYDVVVKIDGSYENISKITTNSVYTINGNQYYCPGTSVKPSVRVGGHEYRQPLYLFKL
jgi:hypothetical protein